MASAMLKTIRSNAKDYVLTTAGTESYVNGYAVKATPTESTIKAHIQPMGAKELRNVPEGQNTLKWITAWSEVDLPEKYKITYGSVLYTIQKTEFWDDGPFYKAAAVHVDDTSN